jgi:hypothetical protein
MWSPDSSAAGINGNSGNDNAETGRPHLLNSVIYMERAYLAAPSMILTRSQAGTDSVGEFNPRLL